MRKQGDAVQPEARAASCACRQPAARPFTSGKASPLPRDHTALERASPDCVREVGQLQWVSEIWPIAGVHLHGSLVCHPLQRQLDRLALHLHMRSWARGRCGVLGKGCMLLEA